MSNAGFTIWQRAYRSWAFRSGPVYRRILERLPPPRCAPKPRLDLALLTMCGAAHCSMLESCLYSIARYWNRLPDLMVVSDGTMGLGELDKRFKWWPGPRRVVAWESYLEHHRGLGRPALAEYAAKDPFGRKLAAILAEAERQRTLWCDADILFFSDFSLDLEAAPRHSPLLWTTLDWAYGYDQAIVGLLTEEMRRRPPVNTGLVLAEGAFYESCGLDDMVRAGLATCDSLTEQTVLAKAVHTMGNIQWPLGKVDISDGEIFTWAPTFTQRRLYVRHYIKGLRQLFWRDALFMRLLRPEPTTPVRDGAVRTPRLRPSHDRARELEN